jgi:hypothetical protein
MSTTTSSHGTISVYLHRAGPLARFKETALWACVLPAFFGLLLITGFFPRWCIRSGFVLLGVSPLLALHGAALVERFRSNAGPGRLSPRWLLLSRIDRRGEEIERLKIPDGFFAASVKQERWMALPAKDAKPSELIAFADSPEAQELSGSVARTTPGTFTFRVVRRRGPALMSGLARLTPVVFVVAVALARAGSGGEGWAIFLFIVSLPLAWFGLYLGLRRYEELAIGEQGMRLGPECSLPFSALWEAKIADDALHVFPAGRREDAAILGFRVYPDPSISPHAALTLMVEIINGRSQWARQRAQRKRDREKAREQGLYRMGGEE